MFASCHKTMSKNKNNNNSKISVLMGRWSRSLVEIERNEFWLTTMPSKTELTTKPGVLTQAGTVGVGTTAGPVLEGLPAEALEAVVVVVVVTWAVVVPARYWRQAKLTNAMEENVGFIIVVCVYSGTE